MIPIRNDAIKFIPGRQPPAQIRQEHSQSLNLSPVQSARSRGLPRCGQVEKEGPATGVCRAVRRAAHLVTCGGEDHNGITARPGEIREELSKAADAFRHGAR
jgi:hypothetical protein